MHLNEIVSQLKQVKNVIISAHTNPDGDAIGAMVAMGHFFKAQNIAYCILLEGPLPKFEYLTQHVNVCYEVKEEVDMMVALDCGNTGRLVGYDTYFTKANKTLVIDHHITNDHYGMYNYVQPNASSTSEIIYEIAKYAHVELTKEMAIALYTGVLTDTGGFMHACTGASTMKMAAELISYDFDFSMLYHQLIHEKSLNTIQLQSRATEHLKAIKEGVYLGYITSDDMDEIGATKDDVDSIVSFLKNIKGIEMIAFLYPLQKGGYKLSTRSNQHYNVATFCAKWGGGGHERAAGASLEGDLFEIIDCVENMLKHIEKC